MLRIYFHIYREFLSVTFFIFERFYLFIFLESGEGREKERERNICVVDCHMPPTGDRAGNSGLCPDCELNRQPFGWQASTQSTEAHQPGLIFFYSNILPGFGIKIMLISENKLGSVPLCSEEYYERLTNFLPEIFDKISQSLKSSGLRL